jgi:hypothetical protein
MSYGLLRLVHLLKNDDGSWDGLGLFFVLISEFIGAPLGAGIGSLVALVQARVWPGPPQAPKADDATWDGAVGGALVATLIAPFAAVLTLGALPEFCLPVHRRTDVATVTLVTWLVLIMVAAFLEAKALRRRRRIMASADATGPTSMR